MKVVVVVPGLRLFNPNNRNQTLPMTGRRRSHWSAERAEVNVQKQMVRLALSGLGTAARDELRASPRVTVTLTRIGGKRMDTAGLCACVKYVEDEVASWLRPDLPPGQADDPKHGVTTVYPPEWESGEYAVRITLETPEPSVAVA